MFSLCELRITYMCFQWKLIRLNDQASMQTVRDKQKLKKLTAFDQLKISLYYIKCLLNQKGNENLMT